MHRPATRYHELLAHHHGSIDGCSGYVASARVACGIVSTCSYTRAVDTRLLLALTPHSTPHAPRHRVHVCLHRQRARVALWLRNCLSGGIRVLYVCVEWICTTSTTSTTGNGASRMPWVQLVDCPLRLQASSACSSWASSHSHSQSTYHATLAC